MNRVSYSQVLSDSREVFRDRIVLVGIYTVGIGDYYFIIYKEPPMFGVEVHANILQTCCRALIKKEFL